jgi:uncharacterized membrane protein YjgN (DUF898 family)
MLQRRHGPKPAKALGGTMTTVEKALRIEQTSSVGNFVWLGFWSSWVSLITLTLFRFWARTMFRKQLWRETFVGGEPLEYVGKGSEKFVGFLIACVTIGIPAGAIILGVQFMFNNPVALGAAFAVIYVIFLVLAIVALFLSRRYILSRTMYRGVRFSQGGKPLDYLWRALGYGLLTLVTLGWYAPVMRLKLAEFAWGQVKYGDLAFNFDSSPENRSEPLWKSFGLAYAGGVLLYAGYWAIFVFAAPDITAPGEMPDMGALFTLYLALLGFSLALLPLMAWHEVAMLRQITKSISIGDVKLSSQITTWEFIGLAISNVLLVIVTFGFAAFAVQMRNWRWIARKLELAGAVDFTAIHQAAIRGPGQGEGMADAFDLGGAV